MEFFNLGARSDVDGGMKNWINNSTSTNFEALLMYNKTFHKISVNAIAVLADMNATRRKERKA